MNASSECGVDRVYEAWSNALEEQCGRYDTILPDNSQFVGYLTPKTISNIDLSKIETNARRIVKKRADSGLADLSHYFLIWQKSGTSIFEHFGQSVTLKQGDIVVMDQRYPCQFLFNGFTEQVSYSLPIDVLEETLGGHAKSYAQQLISKRDYGTLVKTYMMQVLTECEPDDLTIDLECDVHTLIRLLGSALPNSRKVPSKDVRKVRRNQTKLYIKKHIFDHDLDVSKIHSGNHLSRRQLYRLFEEKNTTPCEWIKRTRLEAAEKMLLSATHQRQSVSDIMYAAGFNDLAYFTRIFAKHFGIPPGQYRKLYS